MTQRDLVNEFVDTYGLSPEQISFEGEREDPIFDYEALNVLRLRLTDIQGSYPEIVERTDNLITAQCTLHLGDGRTASDLGTAYIGETMPDESSIETLNQAQNLALARAFRRAIRSAGVNLLKAHKRYLETGEPTTARQDTELNSRIGREIHALASEVGHITNDGKEKYQDFIEHIFGKGKRSSLDLNDIERNQLVATYRQLKRHIENAKDRDAAAA